MSLSAKGELPAIRTDGTTHTNIVGDSACLSECTILGSSRAGDNLFHSFSELSIPENVTVTFLDEGATNIFTWVSEKASVIDGTLAVTGNGDANFFLINPHGVVFGPTAAIAIAGSFITSTAESIVFADEAQFSAVENKSPLLTISAPVGLQFGANPGTIINRSQADIAGTLNALGASAGLQVSNGKTLSLIGSGVYLEGGNLTANSGQVTIASVAANRSVSLSPDLTMGYDNTSGFENVYLTERSLIDASGNEGSISIRGRSIIANSAGIANLTAIDSSAGSVELIADEAIDFSDGGIFLSPAFDSTSDGASLTISTGELALRRGAIISSGTFGSGNGGNITINALNSVELNGTLFGFPTLITSSTQGDGIGGNIAVNTNRLTITDGAQIQAITYGQGRGGDIIVKATERVDIRGEGETAFSGTSVSGISAASGLEGLPFQLTGSGGSLSITTGGLVVSDRAQVSVNSLGQGDAGDLNIAARAVRLDNRAQITAAAAVGNGGNLYLQELETLVLRRESTISTQAGIGNQQGNGGNIFVDADFVVARQFEDSDIVAKAALGQGGNIDINTRGLYGIEQRRAIANNRTNDIDASSDFGVSGTIEINRFVSGAALDAIALAEQPLETAATVSKRCDATGNRFVVTARGGVPANPHSAIEIHSPLVDLGVGADLAAEREVENTTTRTDETDTFRAAPLEQDSGWIEASGWSIDASGQVALFAQTHQSGALPHLARHCTGQAKKLIATVFS